MPTIPIDPVAQDSLIGLMILNQNVLATDLQSKSIGVYYSRLFKKPSEHIWYQVSWDDSQTSETFLKAITNVQIRTGSNLPYLDPKVGTERYTLDEFNQLIKNKNVDYIDGLLYKWNLGRSLLGINPQGTGVYAIYATGTTEIPNLGTAKNTTRLYANTQTTATSGNYTIINAYPFGIQLQHVPKYQQVYINGYTESPFNSSLSSNQYYVHYTGNRAGFIEFGKKSVGQTLDITYTYENTRQDPVWNYWSLPILHNKAYIANNMDHDYLQLRIEFNSLDTKTIIDMYKITVSSLLKKDRQPNEVT